MVTRSPNGTGMRRSLGTRTENMNDKDERRCENRDLGPAPIRCHVLNDWFTFSMVAAMPIPTSLV